MAKEEQPAEQPAHRSRRSGQAALEGTRQSPEPTTAAEDPAAPPDDGPAPQRRGTTAFPIVGVGASAGGLEAFTHFLRALPADTGMAFVLVQHLLPEQESRLVELLSQVSTLPVITAEEGMAVTANEVYVIPPNTYLMMAQGAFHLVPRSEITGLNMPIDYFLRALAE